MVSTDTNDAQYVISGQPHGATKSKVSGEVDSKIGLQVEFNKLLVPTPPVYEIDPATNSPKIDPNTGKYVIAAGKDPDRSVPEGIFGSFNDAPGGMKEELQEINVSQGMEYWYNNVFAARAGYFYEPKTKGSRQFFTFGAGVKYSIITIDGSFLVPTVLNNPQIGRAHV